MDSKKISSELVRVAKDLVSGGDYDEITADLESITKLLAQAYREGQPLSRSYGGQANIPKFLKSLRSMLQDLEKMRKMTKREWADWMDIDGGHTASSDGHYHIEGNKIYVDSNFVNNSQNLISGSKLEHMGFGEFYLDTPDGRIDFDRMRGKAFDGQSGRPHLLTDEVGGKLAKKLVKKMAQSGRAVEASRSLEALTDWVDDDIEESMSHLAKADKLISNISRNTGGRVVKKLSQSLRGLMSDLNNLDSEDLEV